MNGVRELFARYKSYHRLGPQMLLYAGVLGTIAYPAFYILRFRRADIPYDDLAVRAVATLLCLLLVLRPWWPQRLRRFYLPYSYGALIFSLPLAFVFTSLKNGGGTVAVANTLMAIFFVILMTDWRNTIAMLGIGVASAVGLYVLLDPAPEVPADYVDRVPLFLLVVVGGCLFKIAGSQAAAERIRRAYAAMAGSIAHEMRNPLGQVQHSLEKLRDELPPAASVEPVFRHLAQSERAVRRGLQLIAMTLDEVHARPVDPAGFALLSAAEVVQKAIDEYVWDTDAARERLVFRIEEDFSVRADETALMFVLFNLLRNAFFYLPLEQGMRVEIKLRPHEIRVFDSGPGISPELRRKLFEPFSTLGKSGGTGLGLAYCRRVMRSFGGDIVCESEVGRFTEFILSFPPVTAQEMETERQAMLAQARATLCGRRILVVDDDAAQRMTTRHKLRLLEVEIDEAADGHRALERLASRRYDLVLLDLNMPVVDGYGVARRIRQGALPLNQDTRLIAYTSEPLHVAQARGRSVGIDGYLSKPSAQLPLILELHRAMWRAPRTTADTSMFAGRRIVLADDSAFNRKAVAAYLRSAGAVVMEAAHGDAVLALLDEGAGADLALLDIEMPGKGGLETAAAIRTDGKAWSRMPIVALTAYSDAHVEEAGRRCGINGFLVKPVDAGLLYETLRPLLGGAGAGAPAPKPSSVSESLLNTARLESYRRLGMLDELLQDYLPEICRILARLREAHDGQRFDDALNAMHSLLGMSGEAGATALHQLVRRLYAPMVEQHQWPGEAAWLRSVEELAERSAAALRQFVAQPAPSEDRAS